jgi:hypothetical protein
LDSGGISGPNISNCDLVRIVLVALVAIPALEFAMATGANTL